MTTNNEEIKEAVGTMLHGSPLTLDAGYLLTYADFVESLIDTLSNKDPRLVHRDGKEVFTDDAIVDTYIDVHVFDWPNDQDVTPESPMCPNADELETVSWTVDLVNLKMKTIFDDIKDVPYRAEIVQTDYLREDGEDLKDDDDFKYLRTYVVAFYEKK